MNTVENGPPVHEVVGSIHIHSDYSDGTRTIPDISRIAGSVGIDYLLFADHMTLKSLDDGLEGWYGNTLSLIGYEINDRNNINHYLVFGLNKVLDPDMSPPEYVKQVKKLDGIGFIAHPDEVRDNFPEHPPYPWTYWEVNEFDGIEIWNHSSEWLEKVTPANKYWNIIKPRSSLRGPPDITLERWDRISQKRLVSGIGGIDAHAYPYNWGPFTIKIFAYKVLFKGIRTHLLLPRSLPRDINRAKKLIFGALTGAHAFISNYKWGDAKGFRFYMLSGDMMYHMGDTIKCGQQCEFHVTSPLKGKIILKRDGIVVKEVNRDRNLTFKTRKKGVYRVEVFRGKKVWIFSNHIRVV